jgi:hypothetical protein
MKPTEFWGSVDISGRMKATIISLDQQMSLTEFGTTSNKNPVKAGLAPTAGEFQWSSAFTSAAA